MTDGEFAVLFSGVKAQAPTSEDDVTVDFSTCAICSTLLDAEAYAAEQAAAHPTIRCRIYDHDGLGKAPLREVRGSSFKPESEMSARVRRWLGGSLFGIGSLLAVIDWHADFRYMWPSMLGTRMLVPGGTLLVIEGAVLLHAAQKRRQEVHA